MHKKLFVFISMSIMVVMLSACSSSNISPVVDAPNGTEQEETTITEQVENRNSDSDADATATLEVEPTEELTATSTPTKVY